MGPRIPHERLARPHHLCFSSSCGPRVGPQQEANQRNDTMSKPIHHAITKRATKLGCAIIDTGEGFRIEHKGRLSQDTFDSAKEAVDTFATGGMVFEARKGNFCGVMVASYHDRYEHNVHGPGSCDGLDCALRDEYTGENGVDVQGLFELGRKY